MNDSAANTDQSADAGPTARVLRIATLSLLTAILAWSPFPLGGAVSWGAPLQELAIALCWIVGALALAIDPRPLRASLSLVGLPGILVLAVLSWAVVQTLSIVPTNWAHPLWSMTSEALGRAVPAVISIDPWRTISQVLKLASCALAFGVAFWLARRSEGAQRLLIAIIAITAAYALYGLALAIFGATQASIIYGVAIPLHDVSGPFMNRNSFATYAGLGTLAAFVKLFDMGSETVVASRGLRPFFLTALQFAFGRGAFLLVAALLLFASVVASASRAGFAATSIGLIAIGVVSALAARRSQTRLWTLLGVLGVALPLMLVLLFNADTLSNRLAELVDAGTADAVRLVLWDAAYRMIVSAPWTGLGLGTFQDAYPMYAVKVLPFIMDKAHCDYLEFAAGLGLPAAIAWWLALIILAMLCLRGAIVRRRNQLYPLLAFGASVLVAVHSSVDFSLQMPAVALLYAVLLGIGVAQCESTRR